MGCLNNLCIDSHLCIKYIASSNEAFPSFKNQFVFFVPKQTPPFFL